MIIPFIRQQFTDKRGKWAAQGTYYVYNAGSDVEAPIFADEAMTTPISQPMVLDGNGVAPNWSTDGRLIDVTVYDSNGNEIYSRESFSANAGGGSGSGAEDHKVAADSTDTAPDYLIGKLGTDGSITWSLASPGGVHEVQGAVSQSWLASWLAEQGYTVGTASDHKVLGDGLTGDVAGYLIAKLVDADGNPLSANEAHQIVLPFARLDGAVFTGSVAVAGQLSSQGDTALATGQGATVHLVGPATIEQAIANILKLPGVTAGQWLMVNGSGQVVGVTAPTSDHKVLYDASDAIPGFLGVKVVQGSGIAINWTNDVINGKVMHININPAYTSRTLVKSYLASLSVNTTPQTIISNLAGAGLTIPKNSLSVGDVIRMHINCPITSGGLGDCLIEAYLNGFSTIGQAAFAANPGSFVADIDMIVSAIGPDGVIEMSGYGTAAGPTTAKFVSHGYGNGIDTTIDNTFDIMATSSTSITLERIHCTVEKL